MEISAEDHSSSKITRLKGQDTGAALYHLVWFGFTWHKFLCTIFGYKVVSCENQFDIGTTQSFKEYIVILRAEFYWMIIYQLFAKSW